MIITKNLIQKVKKINRSNTRTQEELNFMMRPEVVAVQFGIQSAERNGWAQDYDAIIAEANQFFRIYA